MIGLADRRTLVWQIFLNGEFYGSEVGYNPNESGRSPSVTGSMGGTTFDISGRLKSITLKSAEGKKTTIELVFYNEDLNYFESPLMMKGQDFFISFGYPGLKTNEMEAKITEIKGFQTIKVMAEVIDLFQYKQRNRTWRGVTPSDIVRQIAKEAGFVKTVIELTTSYYDVGFYNQINMTNFEFLNALAIDNGFRFYITIENKIPTLHWHRRNLSTPPFDKLTWRGGKGELKKFDITENSILARTQKVTVLGYDPLNRVPIEATTSGLTTVKKFSLGNSTEVVKEEEKFIINKDTGVGAKTPVKTSFDDVEKKSAKPVESFKEAKAQTEATYQKTQEEQIKAKATLVGYPNVFIGAVVYIDGLPTMLAGNYLVTGYQHKFSISGGFVTNVNLARDAFTSLPVSQSKMTTSKGKVNKKPPVPGTEKKMTRVFNISKETGVGGAAFVPPNHPSAARLRD